MASFFQKWSSADNRTNYGQKESKERRSLCPVWDKIEEKTVPRPLGALSQKKARILRKSLKDLTCSRKMSDSAASPVVDAAAPQEEKKLKPCCACPETKKVRDAW